ncbi:MAG: triose-phosphate isomerase [Pseudomonadota bacterium]
MPRPLVAGNWKMNGQKAAMDELAALEGALSSRAANCDVLICPPFTLLGAARTATKRFSIGAQDCHFAESGAHTGDVSAAMLKDVGCDYVIVGHSERRADHGETDTHVKAKAEAALSQGLTAIVCVGETEAQRDAGETLSIIHSQVAGSLPKNANAETVVIAYEPVWAIGTGRTPSVEDVEQVHTAIRSQLEQMGPELGLVRLLYGGSVKPANARELMGAANVDGALVGGASLKASDFDGIIDAYRS